MTAPFAHIAGNPATRVELFVPSIGVWYADVDLASAPELSGRVTLTIGDREFVGTVDPRYAGTFALGGRVRIVGGAGGWGKLIPAKAYHNDAGVRAQLVAGDVATAIGETLGGFAPSSASVGLDYIRESGPAARVLEDVIGGVAWWVDFAGLTQVGARSTSTPATGSYEVLEHDPRSRLVQLAVDDVGAVVIGSQLSDRLDQTETVRELEVLVDESGIRIRAWCGGSSSAQGRLADAFRRVFERIFDSKVMVPVRYRVIALNGDRVDLQVVRRGSGFPDMIAVSMSPGVAGAHAELVAGAEVLVQFVEGSRSMPLITHFAGKDGIGWTPANLTLDATTLIKLGKDAAQFVSLANLVLERLTAIRTAFNAHIHAVSGGNTLIPTVDAGNGIPLPVQASVAASKVKAQ